jgi:alkylation response protein AidB-like acyl-CoA dehydrogenase
VTGRPAAHRPTGHVPTDPALEEKLLTIDVPTRDELVRRVAESVPALRSKAAWSEENRRLHEETITTLAGAGVFRLRTPKRYGGYECDTRTLVDVAAELARADGSTPDVRVCGTLSPTAMATPVDGGVVVNGRWGFVSGALHSHWQEIVAVQVGPGAEPMPIIALVPISDLQIVDDWHTAGLKGTGSVTTVAQEVFVPASRVLPLGAVLSGQPASAASAASAIYRAPLLPVASASSVGTAIGLAKAAREAFFERLPERKITYTDYESQRVAPLTHLQVADATMKIDEAEFHAHRLAATVDAKAATGEPWTIEERARARADMGAACRLAKEAVDVLNNASGGGSIYSHVPIQRIERDVQALNLHALMHPDTNAELYGRVLCGLEPNTHYI